MKWLWLSNLLQVGNVGKARAMSRAESPIERKFIEDGYDAIRELGAVQAQYDVGPYRIDVAIPSKKLAIELDGYDAHTDKEQFTHDRERDRYLLKHGWIVIHFSGREVYCMGSACADDVCSIAFAHGAVSKWRRLVRL